MRNAKRYEREYADMQCSLGHHCERIAGSGSASEAVCDCVLFKDGFSYLVEVKTTKELVFYVRKHIREQLERMNEKAQKQRIHSLLAVKFKHHGWKELDITEYIPEAVKW
jgi:Holliday junction resolvase